MDIESTNLATISAYLAGRHAPFAKSLPRSLASATPAGCAVIDWHGKPATMLCFRSGKPLGPGQVADVWLFVANQNDVIDAPEGTTRTLTQMDTMATAAWSQGGEVYMLGVLGDEDALKKYL